MLNLFLRILNIPKWICFEKKYDCISATTVCGWIPEVLLKIFRKLCIFLSAYNLIPRQQHLLKMVSWICQIIQLKSKLNYYSVSLKTIQRPRGLSRNYLWMSEQKQVLIRQMIFFISIVFYVYTFQIFFPRISEKGFYLDYIINVIFRCNQNYLTIPASQLNATMKLCWEQFKEFSKSYSNKPTDTMTTFVRGCQVSSLPERPFSSLWAILL